MAVSIRTVNSFYMHFRKEFPNEVSSVDKIIHDDREAKRLADMCAGAAATEELKILAKRLLSEQAEGGSGKVSSKVSSTADISVDESWNLLTEAARAAGGPIAGAMVKKYRRENPLAGVQAALEALGRSLGDKFSKEAQSRGL